MSRKQIRMKRALKIRSRIKESDSARLSVHKTSKHIYVQLISSDGMTTLASSSTVQSEIRQSLENTGNINAAIEVGKSIANKALALGITKVAFDRSGFKYHGRIKALADSAREIGLIF